MNSALRGIQSAFRSAGILSGMKERMMASDKCLPRARSLHLTLQAYQTADGKDFVRICRGPTELADVADGDVGAWLMALSAQTWHAAATASR